MKAVLFIILVLLISCEEKSPVFQSTSAPKTNPTLAAAQFTLARNHLDNEEPQKAIPYLAASLANHSSAKTQSVLDKILASTHFALPVIELRHPFSILHFKETGENLFVAIGGKHPTVIRWNLPVEPTVGAVMFPAQAKEISHLFISPNGKFILTQRDSINLLCHADTLKPITALNALVDGLDPEAFQPFTQDGLFFASPTAGDFGKLTWQIRDSATGQTLRSEEIQTYSKPTAAAFEGSTLQITMDDGSGYQIPLQGEVELMSPSDHRISMTSPASHIFPKDEKSLTITRTIRLTPDEILKCSAVTLAALSGYKLDPTTQTLTEIPTPNRLETLATEFPGKLPETLRIYSSDTPITQRFAAAYPADFPQLTAAARSHSETIEKIFATKDRDAILAMIDTAAHGLPFATALFLALDSGKPEFISRAIEKATDLPPALLALAMHNVPPETDFDHLRQIEDWHGYESPDFTPLLNRFRKEQADAFSALTLPVNPSADDVSAFSLKLIDPTSLQNLGQPAIAEKALTAARTLSGNPEHAATSIQLADYAQRLGTPPAACMRIHANALTTLADFDAAHTTWINLITHQPQADHLPTDYTEAAYTAFETGDPRQAIEILNTGIFRFPRDPSSAIRSGWIALLTDHTEDSLRYLSHATQLGLPPSEIENTTALLAIAHERLGDRGTALSYIAQLKAISPKWTDPQSLAKLPWPEPFKNSLNAIISSDGENEFAPLPENDPIDTAPLPAEFPIEEPPLPSR